MKIPYIRPIVAPTQKLSVSELKKNIEALRSLSKFQEDNKEEIDGIGQFIYTNYTSARNEVLDRRNPLPDDVPDEAILAHYEVENSIRTMALYVLPRAEDIKFKVIDNAREVSIFSLANIDSKSKRLKLNMTKEFHNRNIFERRSGIVSDPDVSLADYLWHRRARKDLESFRSTIAIALSDFEEQLAKLEGQ